jgi:drug/metabolite transporter (DMT)-like permease
MRRGDTARGSASTIVRQARAAAGRGALGPHRYIGAMAAVLCTAWATTFVVQRVAVGVAAPVWVAALRLAVAAVVLLPLARSLRGLGRRGLAVAGVLGVVQQAGFVGLQVAGLRTVGAGPAAAIIYLQPILVVLAAPRVLGERLTGARLGGALLGFAGVAIISVHQASVAAPAGVLLLLGSSLAWTAGTLLTSAARQPVVAIAAGQHLVGAPLLLGAAAIVEPFPALSATLVLCVIFAGVFGSALAWTLFSALLARGEAGVVSTWLFAVPVAAAALGVVVLGEDLSAALVVGIVLVAAAVRLATASARR